MNNADVSESFPDGARPEVHIRRAAETDLPAILQIERACFSAPWSEGMFRSEFTNRWSRVLLAEAPGADGRLLPVGFMVIWLLADELHINNVAVLPGMRRRGIGRSMMQEVLRLAAEGGAVLATLEVRRSNTPARCLYESFGFAVSAVRRAYYEDGEDAFVMLRTFP